MPTTDLSSREVTGVEARLGWRHPKRGVVPPLTFLPVLESLFKRTTDITLLELTDLNHPLLRRMQLEAPGTYHHSLVVQIRELHEFCRVTRISGDGKLVIHDAYRYALSA